jgi:molybdopterin/thiamine biosynthesis adenylyltransferase
MTVVPGKGPCLCCLFSEVADSEDPDSVGSFGILNTIPALVGALQVTEAFKLLLGAETEPGRLLDVNLWTDEFRYVTIPRDPKCPVCGDL